MCSYQRLRLSMLVLAFLTTTMCAFASEVEISISENRNAAADLKHDGHHLETQQSATATLKDITDAGGGGGGGSGVGNGVAGVVADGGDIGLELLNRLRFEPSQLDFGIWSVGTVQSHTVTLVNQNRNRSVYLSSVTGRTPSFYSSLFEAKTVPPNGNTTFDVVFLPRENGAVSTNLHIHTSFGQLLLMVRGEGRACPYRLKPLVGIKAPLNATLMPMIHMYNPHERSLQILEIYSSGGQFQLELPSGDPEGPQGLWEIPPYSMKPIIRIRFQGYTAGNHSAYIRIKIAEPQHQGEEEERGNEGESEATSADSSSASMPHTKEQVLVIPVEFEILPDYGLYAVNPLIDFGYVNIAETTKKKILKQKLFLRHSKNQLDIQDLEFESLTPLKGVTMDTSMASNDDGDDADDGTSNIDISTIALDPKEVSEPVTYLNENLKLILKHRTTKTAVHTYHNVELIVRAHIFKGSLHYDKNSTLILDQELALPRPAKANDSTVVPASSLDVNGNLEKPRHITLRNDFQIPIQIYNITTRFNDSSKLNLYLEPMKNLQENNLVLQPGHALDLTVAFRLATRTGEQKEQQEDLKDLIRNYKTAVYVYTNITNFQIPFVVSSTRLFVTTQTLSLWRSNSSVYTKEIQLSSVPFREFSHKGFIILQNRNSIPIKLNNWDFQKTSGIYYVVKFAGSVRAMDINASNDYTVDLEKCDYRLNSILQEGDIAVFEVNLLPYTELSTAYLNIATTYENITIAIKFNIVFGKLEVDQEKLHFANCFPGKICSSELSIRSTFNQPIHMKYINFSDPGLRFVDRNSQGSMIAANSVTTVGRIYFEPSALCGTRCYIPQQTDEATTFPISSQVDKILNMPHFDEVELRRRTELYRHFKSYFQSLDFTMTTREQQDFQLNLMIEIQWPQLIPTRQVIPTVEVNKTQVFEVKVSNPSDKPILIDYSLADPKLAKQTQITLPLEVIILTPTCYLTDKAVFSLVNPPPKKPILIPGLTSIRVPITFRASSMGNYCTLLHIRNNLTLYEGTWISAKAVQSQFRLGNRKPGSPTPLLFEISEQQLSAACPPRENKLAAIAHPQITTRRVFTARNSGELPIWIESFWIGDQPCKGYGFQIMDCKSFELKANSSKTIEIQFQTDFTATRITKVLTLKTNLTYAVNYKLVAQLPSKGLDQCSALLPRPPWEDKIRNATIVMLIITFVLVLIAVHIDYGNIMYTQSTLYGAREKGTIHPTFNLRNIAMRQNNNENTAANVELTLKNKSGLKKRNIGGKQQRLTTNGELAVTSSSTSSSFSALPNMTLAEMVSWTFGTKTGKKTNKVNRPRDAASATPSATSTANSSNTVSDAKTFKNKLTEKSLVEKMDEDLKKAQISKKAPKATEKIPSKPSEEEVKTSKEEPVVSKEMKKEKPVISKSPTNKTISSPDHQISATAMPSKEQRKSLDSSIPTHVEPITTRQVRTPPPVIQSNTSPVSSATVPVNKVNAMPMTEITNQQTPMPKEASNGRKLGKTPGRERRKQTTQNTSPTTSSCSSASTSSSSSSSLPQHPQHNTAKRFERKPQKSRAMNSLKFSGHSMGHANSIYSQMAAAANDHNDQTFHQDVLSPWDYSSHITFSDVLQQTQQFANAQATANSNSNSTATTLLNTDLMYDAMSQPSTASSTPPPPFARAENVADVPSSKADLGPIGSRKSPSSTPAWETMNSAISLQLPRPLNTTITTTSAITSPAPPPPLPPHPSTLAYDLQGQPNYGLNNLLTARQTIQQIAAANAAQKQQQQHDFDIAAKLRAIKAHEILRLQQLEEQLLQQQQQQQQQQQFMNYNQMLNNNWTTTAATPNPGWTAFLGNGVGNLPTSHHSNGDIFGPVTSSSAWIPPVPSSMEQHYVPNQQFPINMEANNTIPHTVAVTSSSAAAAAVPTSASNNNLNATTTNINNASGLNVSDNMPMFNLFGGLSSIWNDNWKQSTSQQQQQQNQQKPSE